MPEAPASIFNKQASDRLHSPDDLDKYIHVTSPSVWVVLMAVLSLIAGLLSWGVFGAVSTNVSVTGTSAQGLPLCLLDAEQAAKVHVGDLAYVDSQQTKVDKVNTVPLSRDEVREMLGSDYLVDVLMKGQWAYVVTFEDIDSPIDGVPLSVSITTERVAPISLVLG